MFVVSNALVNQAEIEQTDHWERGPLEFVFFDSQKWRGDRVELIGLVSMWNRDYEWGSCRDDEALENLRKIIPGLGERKNPNLFLVPRAEGFSQLDVMLGSVVPTRMFRPHGVQKRKASFWLLPFKHHEMGGAYGDACRAAFERYIWTKLARSSRCRYDFFAPDSPLRLLASDSQYWMSRLYRVAIARYETFEPTTHIDHDWKPLEVLEAELAEQVPDYKEQNLVLRRPRMGGTLWDIEDDQECEEVVEEMLDGLGLMEPIDPLVDLLHSHQTHEDFSDRYSWIKEDFERSFYSKRSRVKVVLVETADEFPSWHAEECCGHEDLLFRDLLSCFDRREQRLLVALRHGKTTTEIAREMGLKGHASVSRKIAQIKERVRRLLN